MYISIMNTITATELRTKTKELFEAMLNGEEISVGHRSKVIGVFKPKKQGSVVFDAKKFSEIVEKMNSPKRTMAEIDKRYRAAMMKKHGKHLPRH